MSYGSRKVASERSGWRDAEFSARHRLYGYDCAFSDVDWIEYDRGKVVAIVEIKNEHASRDRLENDLTRNWSPIRALRDLGTRAGVPVFLCIYQSEFNWFEISPLNIHATKYVESTSLLSERQWVEILYRVRGRTMPNDPVWDDSGKLLPGARLP